MPIPVMIVRPCPCTSVDDMPPTVTLVPHASSIPPPPRQYCFDADPELPDGPPRDRLIAIVRPTRHP